MMNYEVRHKKTLI